MRIKLIERSILAAIASMAIALQLGCQEKPALTSARSLSLPKGYELAFIHQDPRGAFLALAAPRGKYGKGPLYADEGDGFKLTKYFYYDNVRPSPDGRRVAWVGLIERLTYDQLSQYFIGAGDPIGPFKEVGDIRWSAGGGHVSFRNFQDNGFSQGYLDEKPIDGRIEFVGARDAYIVTESYESVS